MAKRTPGHVSQEDSKHLKHVFVRGPVMPDGLYAWYVVLERDTERPMGYWCFLKSLLSDDELQRALELAAIVDIGLETVENREDVGGSV